MAQCKKCKKEFVPVRASHIYCSKTCKKRWYDGTPKGKATIFRYHMKPEVKERRREQQRVIQVERHCKYCGLGFIGKKVTKVYCSARCYQAAWYRRKHAMC